MCIRLSKEHTCSITGEAKCKVETFKNVEGNVELNQKRLCVFRLSKRRAYNISGTAQGIKLKLSVYTSRLSKGEFTASQKQLTVSS